MKGSTQQYVQTKQQCITFMKEYAEKSLEELRIEDYAANRKGPQQGGAGMFGATQQSGVFGGSLQQNPTGSLFTSQQNTQQQSTGLFGSTANTLGGGAAFGQPTSTFGQQNTSLFGKPLATPATTSSAFTAFGSNTQNTFGVQKPFGQVAGTPSTGLFGQSQAPAFGVGQQNSFGQAPAFGQTQPAQSNSLFGTNQTSTAPSFGMGATPTPSTSFFGQTNTTSSLFGAPKPTFNTGGAPFGATQSSATTTGFQGFGQQTGTSLFNQNKPSGFGGFGQPQTQTTQSAPFGQNPGGSLFGNTNQQTGLFGSTAPNTGGLFGGSSNAFGGGSTGLSFGNQQQSLFGG